MTSPDESSTWMLDTRNITNLIIVSKGTVYFKALFVLDNDVKQVALLYNGEKIIDSYRLKKR